MSCNTQGLVCIEWQTERRAPQPLLDRIVGAQLYTIVHSTPDVYWCCNPNRSFNDLPEAHMSIEINRDRRRFIRTAAMTVAATHFAEIGLAHGQSSKAVSALPPVKSGANTAFS